MRMSKLAVLMAVIYLSFLVSACAGNLQVIINNDDKNKLSHLSGTILINIMSSEYHDYAFRLPMMTMQEIAKGKVVREEKSGRSVCQSSNFKNVWNKIRGKQYLDEKQFNMVFDRFDLSDLHPLVLELIRNRHKDVCNTKKIYKLREKSPIQPQKAYPSDFSINDQKSFAVYNSGVLSLLINLGNMTISNAFCNKPVNKPVWDKTGQYLAYATSTSSQPDELIAVTNIKDASVLMEKSINKHFDEIFWNQSKRKFEKWNQSKREFEETTYNSQDSLPDTDYNLVADIAWNPSSEYIAVLTYKSRIGLWPWELLPAAAGHPISHNTFFLSIYDMTGKELLTQKIISNVVNERRESVGSLVWTDGITESGLGR
jgi:hypothetical protein